MDKSSTVVRVAVPVPLYRCFDYLCDKALEPGCRVQVPFGNRSVIGVVDQGDVESDQTTALKAVQLVLDEQPILPPAMIAQVRWAAAYYHHPLGEVYALALPTRLRKGDALPEPLPWFQLALTTEEALALCARAPVQKKLIERLASSERLPLDRLATNSAERGAVKRLNNAGRLVQVEAAQRTPQPQPGPTLNEQQNQCVKSIVEALGRFQPFLLHGVTGSGKTEVYLNAIEQVLKRGQQALVIVPEIGLTPQLHDRFMRLDASLALAHSGLSDGERKLAWAAAARGDADVIIGTRSAVFMPMPKPGLLIIDEEHDGSLKQADGLRYSARDLAIWRARQDQVPIVLGSATPSLESWSNASNGRFAWLRLDRRAKGRPPDFRLHDIRNQYLEAGLTEAAFEAIGDRLNKGEQVLVFINRRGYAPVMMCHRCGWHVECEQCDTNMVWHLREYILRCHHCGDQRALPAVCEVCGDDALVPAGQGTERLEEVMAERFADFPVIRIDRDSTQRKGEFAAILERLRENQPCIVVGTQMLAKGHDLPAVTLVVVVNVDSGLFSGDFRGAERTAQLIEQVSGRAGRAERPGEAWLLTRHPEHPLLTELIAEGYGPFADHALAERKAAGLPPCAHLAVVRTDAGNRAMGMNFLETSLQTVGELAGVEQFGPMPLLMERRGGWFRAQVSLLAAERAPLHHALEQWVRVLNGAKKTKNLRWAIDVDPQFLDV